MTEIDRAQLAALDASGMHNTGRMQFEYGEFDTVKTEAKTCPGRKAREAGYYVPIASHSGGLIRCGTCGLDQKWDEPPFPCEYKTPVVTPLATQIGGSHYKDMAIQPLDYIMRNGLGFAEGNVVKYVSRWRVKGGVEDLRKARHYLDVLIEGEGEK